MSALVADQAFALAEHWLDAGQPRRTLDALAEADPEDTRTWRLRALAYHDLGEYGRSAQAARRGLHLEPDATVLMDVLASSYRMLGDLPAAERAAFSGLERDPEHGGLLCEYARALMEQGKLPEAGEALARAARAYHPDEPDLLFARAQLAEIENRHEDGIRDVARILALDPGNSHAHAILGAFKAERAWPTQWARHFVEAARHDPGNHEIVGAAREARLVAHPLMVPLWPITRFGRTAVCICGLVAWQVSRHIIGGTVGGIVAGAWLGYCVYSWTMPSLLRRWLMRRGL